MDRLNEYCLISIFKHLDLPSRFQVSKTCKLWRSLLQDPEVLLNDVGEVFVQEWTPDKDKSEVHSVLAVLSNLKSCRQLKLGHGSAHDFLLEQSLKDELARFDKVVMIPEYENWRDTLVPCLSLLPSTVTRLRIDDCVSQRFSLSFPDSVQLVDLSLAFRYVEFFPASFVLPSTLTAYRYSYYCQYISPDSDLDEYSIDSGSATEYFLQNFPAGPLLTDLTLCGLWFNDAGFAAFLRMVRDGVPNLHRISFQGVAFEFDDIDAIRKEYSVDKGKEGRLFPFRRIELTKCMMRWNVVAELMVSASDVEKVAVCIRKETPHELLEVYELTPLIKRKGAKLELSLNSTNQPRDLEEIPVPSELSGVLSKLDLINVHHTQLLQVMLGDDDSFELLTEIRLEKCIGLGDATLEVIAKWCKNLKKLKFQPHYRLGVNAVTDQCLQPFMVYWDDRKSPQLLIECLEPARPFNGFGLPSGQEKGVFTDGKKWMLFRKACLLPGCDQVGTRLVIWEDQIEKGG